MKPLLFVVMTAVAAAAAAEPDFESMFRTFKATYGKVYETATEETKRFEAFVDNIQMSAAIQAANPFATFGITVRSDVFGTESRSGRTSVNRPKGAALRSQRQVLIMSADDKAQAQGAAIDWRTKGVVGPVLSEGDCGGDWAIAAAGNIEGVWAASGRPFVSVSAQELLLCDSLSSGCSGGGSDPTRAFQWLTQFNNGTIATAASLPWNTLAPQCPSNYASLPAAATIRGYINLEQSEDAIAAYVYANGPVIVSLDTSSWATYQGGIFTDCASQEFDNFDNVLGWV